MSNVNFSLDGLKDQAIFFYTWMDDLDAFVAFNHSCVVKPV